MVTFNHTARTRRRLHERLDGGLSPGQVNLQRHVLPQALVHLCGGRSGSHSGVVVLFFGGSGWISGGDSNGAYNSAGGRNKVIVAMVVVVACGSSCDLQWILWQWWFMVDVGGAQPA